MNRGTQGVIFRPPLICDPPQSKQSSNKQIGKIQDEKESKTELEVSEFLKQIDEIMEFSVPVLTSCKIAETQTNQNYVRNVKKTRNEFQSGRNTRKNNRAMNNSFNTTRNNKNNTDYVVQNQQLISAQAGENAQQWLEKHFTIPTPNTSKSVSWSAELSRFFAALKKFLAFLQAFNVFQIHQDLHLRNLVQDGKDVRMIDFGTAKSRDSEQDRLQDKMSKDKNVINNHLDSIDPGMIQNDLRKFLSQKQSMLRFPLYMWLKTKFADEPTAKKIQESLYALPE